MRKPKIKPDQPHAGVDRRRNDMTGRKYKGTTWDELRPTPPDVKSPPAKKAP